MRYAARQLGDAEMARDIVQEAFIQVWERRRGWRSRGSARAYLYRIVRHLVIDEKRKLGVRRRWAERQRLADAPRPATPAEELDAKLLADAFEAAVASLPQRRREVFELVFQRGLSHAETAAVLDTLGADGGQPDERGAARRAAEGPRGRGRGRLRQ